MFVRRFSLYTLGGTLAPYCSSASDGVGWEGWQAGLQEELLVSCKGDKASYDAVLETCSLVPGSAPPLDARCPFCGTITDAGTCHYDDCPSKRPYEDIVVDPAGPNLPNIWHLHPEPPPVRIIRGAWPTPGPVWAVLDSLVAMGGRPYFVGGVNRDRFLGNTEPKDWDIEVHNLSPEQIISAMSPLGAVKIKGERFGVVEIYLGGISCEVAPAREEARVGIEHQAFLVDFGEMSLKQAAERRDVRYAACYGDPYQGEMYDFFGGFQDLEEGRLVHTSPRFAEDSGRVPRVMRQSSQFDLEVDPETIELCRQLLPDFLQLTPGQRKGVLTLEWRAWAIKSKRPSRALRVLWETGWIEAFPELAGLLDVPEHLVYLDREVETGSLPHGVPQDPAHHPEGGVFRHTAHVLEAGKRIADRDGLRGEDREVLMFVALLHDVGKNETTEIDGDQVVSRNHAEASAEKALSFLTSIGLSQQFAERVASLIRWHMDFLSFTGSPKHVRRRVLALAEVGESMEMLARLVEADQWGRPAGEQISDESPGIPHKMSQMLEMAKEMQMHQRPPKPVLTGDDLKEVFGMLPSPFMGQVLEAVAVARAQGAFAGEGVDDEKEAALRWIRDHFRKPREGPWPRRGQVGGRSREVVATRRRQRKRPAALGI